MRLTSHYISTLCAFLTLTNAHAQNDAIELKDGHTFTGQLAEISSDNGIAFQSPRSPSLFRFRPDALSSLKLSSDSEQESAPAKVSESLTLINGDSIPGELLDLNSEIFSMRVFSGQTLSIPREVVRSLRLGISPQRLVYDGPLPLEDWEGSGTKTWLKDNAKLQLAEKGTAYQDVDLARHFIIRFQLNWFHQPDFQIHFCDDGGNQKTSDRYYMHFSHSGLSFRRESSNPTKRYQKLLSLPRDIEAFDDNEIEVEIQGNRLLGIFNLYLDGQLIRENITDKEERTTGAGIRISKIRSHQNETVLSKLQTFTWDITARQHELLADEEPSDKETLVTIDAKSLSGKLESLAIQEDTQAREFIFKSPYVTDPIHIPLEETAFLHLSSQPYTPESNIRVTTVKTVANGRISASSVNLSGDTFTLAHPLLGDLNLHRSLVHSLTTF